MKVCGWCGNPVEGVAQINDTWYCHPDDETKPDCYAMAQHVEAQHHHEPGDSTPFCLACFILDR